MESMNVSQVVDVPMIVIRDLNCVNNNGFELSNDKKSFLVFAENEQEKKEWMDEITKAVEKILNNMRTRNQMIETHIRPLFVPDDRVTKCMICETEFSFFTRRHHCRFCGKCVCNSCSLIRLPQPPFNNFERACNICVNDRVLAEKPLKERGVENFTDDTVTTTDFTTE